MRSLVVAAFITSLLVLSPAVAQGREGAVCQITWDGGAGTRSWGDAANWSGDALPSATQRACIPDIAGTAPVLVDDPIVVGSFESLEDVSITNSFTLEDDNEASTARVVDLGGGSLLGDGQLDVSAAFRWSSGTLGGSGRLRVLPTGTLTISGTSARAVSTRRVLRNEGTGTWSQGTVTFADGTRFENAGLLEITASEALQRIQSGGEGPVLHNTGTLRRGGASLLPAHIAIPIENDGAVEVPTGTLTISAGSPASASTGSFGAAGQGGELTFSGGEYVLGTGASFAGTTLFTSTLNAAGTVSIGGEFELRGNFSGAGEIRIGGHAIWSSGSMLGSGLTRVLAGGKLDVARSPQSNAGETTLYLRPGRRLRNEGDLSWTFHYLSVDDGAVIENAGTFDVPSGRAMSRGDGGANTPVIRNTGTLTRTSGADTRTTLGVPVDNDGVVESRAGALSLTGNGDFSSTGRFGTTGTAGTIELTGGSFVLAQGASLAGQTTLTGTLRPEGAATLDGSLLQRGTITGAGDLNVAGRLEWRTGSMTGTGTTHVLPGGRMEVAIETSSSALDRLLRNDGTLAWTLGQFEFADGAVLDNRGTFDAVSPGASMTRTETGALTPELRNSGTVTRSRGADTTTTITIAVHNSGTVESAAGALALTYGSADMASTGRFGTAGSGGTVALGGSRAFRLADGTQLAGTVRVTGPVQHTGVVRSEGSLTLASGEFDGSGRLDVAGRLDWDRGAMNGSGSTRILPGATAELRQVTTCCSSSTLARTFRNEGTTRWMSGGLSVADRAVIENFGRFEASAADGTITRTQSGADGPRLINAGTLVRNAAPGTITRVGIPIENDGVLELVNGELEVSARFTQSADAILRLRASGTAARDDFGVLDAQTTTKLGGRLELALDGYTPAVSDTLGFMLATTARRGTFATITGTSMPPGLVIVPQYRTDGVSLTFANAAPETLAPELREDEAAPPVEDEAVEAPAAEPLPEHAPKATRAAPAATPTPERVVTVPAGKATTLTVARLTGRSLAPGERLRLHRAPSGVKLDARGRLRVRALVAGRRVRVQLRTVGGTRAGTTLTVVLQARRAS